MNNALKLVFVALFAAILSGCAGLGQNMLAGGTLGAGIGAAAGDNRESTARGAVAGAVLGGLLLPQNGQQQYGQQYGQQPYGQQQQGQAQCQNGDQLVFVNGQARCQRGQQQYGQQQRWNNDVPCPTILVGNRRQCQGQVDQQYGQTPYGQQQQGQPQCQNGDSIVVVNGQQRCRRGG